MNFDPVDRDLNQWMKEQEPKPWSGTVRITLENIPDVSTVIDCDFDLEDASDEESVIAQIRDIIAHQTHVQII